MLLLIDLRKLATTLAMLLAFGLGCVATARADSLNGFARAKAANLDFHDDALGYVSRFCGTGLDLGFTKGASGNFTERDLLLAVGNGQSSVQFTITEELMGFTQERIADAVHVGFHEVATSPESDEDDDDTPMHHVIPEPTGMLLFGTGLLGASAVTRRWRRK